MNAQMNWIEREISPRLRTALRQLPVVVVTGGRQVGKTSLSRHMWPEASYTTMDIPAFADRARLEGNRFLSDLSVPAILDEIQYVPDLLRHLKIRVDARKTSGMYMITGSQDFLLMQGITESLAGRCAVFTLPQLSLRELVSAGILKKGQEDSFFWRGGYPELWQRTDLDRVLWLGSYVTTYLERDVRNILNEPHWMGRHLGEYRCG